MKVGQGLYNVKENKVYDIEEKEYREKRIYNIPFIDKVIEKFKVADYEDGIKIIMNDESKEAEICRDFLINYIVYGLKKSRDVASKPTDCDIAMVEGFNWIPPYALLEVIGKDFCKNKALEFAKNNKEIIQIINDVFEDDIKSEYRYEKFLKARR